MLNRSGMWEGIRLEEQTCIMKAPEFQNRPSGRESSLDGRAGVKSIEITTSPI